MQLISEQNDLQRVPEWYAERLGRFSCSQFYRLMSDPKAKADKDAGNLSEGAITYVFECIAEKITGEKAKDDFTSKYTDWGIEFEPTAKRIYEEVFSCKVINSEYISFSHNAGGSPDGLIGEDGIIEIKCPFTTTSHLEHKLLSLKDKKEYYWQCIGYLLITGRKWIDFISYHPKYPAKLQVIKKRLTSQECDEDIKRLESKLIKANNLLTQTLKTLL